MEADTKITDAVRSGTTTFACPRCSRPNARARHNCLYCGQFLNNPDYSAMTATSFRRPEPWEMGFQVVCNTATVGEFDLAGTAQLLKLAEADLLTSVSERVVVPFARVDSVDIADRVAAKLAELGLNTVVASDADLVDEAVPVRLRSIEAQENGFTFIDFNSGQRTPVDRQNIRLIVKGIVIETTEERSEQHKRGGRQTLEEFETTSDSSVIDVYSKEDQKRCWRIWPHGFDFSVLGTGKGLLAANNLSLLCDKLVRDCPAAKYVDSYRKLRPILNIVWPPVETVASGGIKRRLGKGSSVTRVASSSNLDQFNRFSRLQASFI